MRPFLMQTKMETIRTFRNPYYVFWSLFMPIVFYFVFTKVFNPDTANQSLYEAHFLMSMTSFSVMGSAIMTLGIRLVEERKHGWTLFLRVTPLSSQAYFLAKMISQSVIHVFSILLIFIIGGVVNSVSLSFSEWLLAGIWILIGSLPFLALGTLVGTMKKVDTASGVSNLIYLSLAITGGMWMPLDIMPKFIQNVALWLPSYNYGDGAWQIIRGSSPDIMNVIILLGYFLLFMLISGYIRSKQEAVV